MTLASKCNSQTPCASWAWGNKRHTVPPAKTIQHEYESGPSSFVTTEAWSTQGLQEQVSGRREEVISQILMVGDSGGQMACFYQQINGLQKEMGGADAIDGGRLPDQRRHSVEFVQMLSQTIHL